MWPIITFTSPALHVVAMGAILVRGLVGGRGRVETQTCLLWTSGAHIRISFVGVAQVLSYYTHSSSIGIRVDKVPFWCIVWSLGGDPNMFVC
jgi:hypothetical protein